MQSRQVAVGAALGLWLLVALQLVSQIWWLCSWSLRSRAAAAAACSAPGRALPPAHMRSMTVEEFAGEPAVCRMEMVGSALEEVLSKAVVQRSLTVGVLEAAKVLNVDPDNVVLCLLAADEDDNKDVALQIHFTLIQAFCCENDISILRVSNVGRLEAILGSSEREEPGGDLHCVLVNMTL